MRSRVLAVVFSAVFVAALFTGCAQSGELKTYSYSPGDPFITNVKGTPSLMLRSEVSIDVVDQGFVQELTDKNHVVRTLISQFLADQDETALYADGAMASLGEALMSQLNTELGKEYCYKVYLQYYTSGG